MKKIVHRQTKQRKVIFEELCRLKTHPTAEELFLLVKKRIPSISLGTVYRNLNLLKKEGKVLELDFQENFSRYDGYTKNHYHFYCSKCKKIYDIMSLKLLNNLKDVFYKKTKFYVKDFRLNLYGLCNNCRK